MDTSHKTAYTELQSMYSELKNYLDSVMLDPEDELLLRKCEHLGDKSIPIMRPYWRVILECMRRNKVALRN